MISYACHVATGGPEHIRTLAAAVDGVVQVVVQYIVSVFCCGIDVF